MNAAHICGSVCLQTAPPLISSPPENDLDSPGCWMCLHTQHTDDIVSQQASLTAARRGMLQLELKLQSSSHHDEIVCRASDLLLSSDCMHDGVNGYWSLCLADSQDNLMVLLRDVFIFALNHKPPSVIRPKVLGLRKGFMSLSSLSSWIFRKGQVLVLLWSSLSPATVSWIICAWFISCPSACSCPGCSVLFCFIIIIAEVGGVIVICFAQHPCMYQS